MKNLKIAVTIALTVSALPALAQEQPAQPKETKATIIEAVSGKGEIGLAMNIVGAKFNSKTSEGSKSSGGGGLAFDASGTQVNTTHGESGDKVSIRDVNANFSQVFGSNG